MPRFIIIYGPPGSGKTLNAAALKHFYDCRMVCEEGRVPASVFKRDCNVLILSNTPKVRDPRSQKNEALEGRVIDIEEAAAALGKRWIKPKVGV